MAYTKVKPLMVSSFPSSRLTGAFGAISGASLTGLSDGVDTKSASANPALNTNPSGGVGHSWLNKSSGEMFICTDATTDANIWANVGAGTRNVDSFQGKISGFTAGGYNGGYLNVIDKFSFTTDGDATDIANLTVSRYGASPASSSTHGYSSAGYTGAYQNIIDKFTFVSTTDATDVGDLTGTKDSHTGCSSSTHGYAMGGYIAPATVDVIEKFTFTADANSTDVGNLTLGRYQICGVQV